jgi:hypothetical protein
LAGEDEILEGRILKVVGLLEVEKEEYIRGKDVYCGAVLEKALCGVGTRGGARG